MSNMDFIVGLEAMSWQLRVIWLGAVVAVVILIALVVRWGRP